MSTSKSIEVHLISSLRRGGRERQITSLLFYSKKKFLVICFNRAQNTYLDEYNISEYIIYLNSNDIAGRLKEIRKIIHNKNLHIVWSWGGFEATYAFMLSLITGIKHINGSIRHGIVKLRFSHIWRMIVLHLSKYRVANSKAGLKANFLRKGYVWYNGLDEAFLRQPDINKQLELKSELGLSGKEDKKILLSIANLVPYKDYLTILKGLISLKNSGVLFTYLIVGEGPDRSTIEHFIDDNTLKNEVILLGRRSDIKELLSISDIFIHSSLGEGCSNAIIEAMAAGKPVIATDTGGTPEIVTDNGFLFKLGDADSFYLQIKKLIENDQLIEEMGKKSYEMARNKFSIERMIEEYQHIIANVSQGVKLKEKV